MANPFLAPRSLDSSLTTRHGCSFYLISVFLDLIAGAIMWVAEDVSRSPYYLSVKLDLYHAAFLLVPRVMFNQSRNMFSLFDLPFTVGPTSLRGKLLMDFNCIHIHNGWSSRYRINI